MSTHCYFLHTCQKKINSCVLMDAVKIVKLNTEISSLPLVVLAFKSMMAIWDD